MTAPFQLDAFEKFLQATDATGGTLDAEVTVTKRGAVVLNLTRVVGGAAAEFARFHVRGHSAVEVSVHDNRFKPARARGTSDDAPAGE